MSVPEAGLNASVEDLAARPTLASEVVKEMRASVQRGGQGYAQQAPQRRGICPPWEKYCRRLKPTRPPCITNQASFPHRGKQRHAHQAGADRVKQLLDLSNAVLLSLGRVIRLERQTRPVNGTNPHRNLRHRFLGVHAVQADAEPGGGGRHPAGHKACHQCRD